MGDLNEDIVPSQGCSVSLNANSARLPSEPFFILHKASHPRKSDKRGRKKMDLSWKSPDNHLDLQFQAFNLVWSKIDSTIKEVLRKTNIDIMSKIACWVLESFNTIRCRIARQAIKPMSSYPLHLNDVAGAVSSNQLFTGIVFTKNMEFVDDILTFADLARNLKSHGCHVANLTSFDFCAKNGLGGCLRSLLRQFVTVSIDAPHISMLASWYTQQGNYENPVVVIIDDIERCCGTVLSDFIIMLSEWNIKIPVILLLGVTTTVDALKYILSSSALQHLSCSEFILGSPAEKMDAVIEAVLVNQCAGFSLSHKVATFLRNYFIRQDGTLTSFLRALKMAISQHFCMQPINLAVWDCVVKEDTKDSCIGDSGLSPENTVEKDHVFSSSQRNNPLEANGDVNDHGFSELRRLSKLWSSVNMCLYEVGKYCNVTLLDLYCEMLDPELYNCTTSDFGAQLRKDSSTSSKGSLPAQQFALQNARVISEVVRKVRDLSATEICKLLQSWEKLTEGSQIEEKVKQLQSPGIIGSKRSRCEVADIPKRHSNRSNIIEGGDDATQNGKVATFIDSMIRDYVRPIECISSHEIFCFKNVDKLQSALIGDPRRKIQVDLLEFHKILKCSCCGKNCSVLSPSMPDTSIMYILAQEHGDLINLHDWFQSFKANICLPIVKSKRRPKQSWSPEKLIDNNGSEDTSNAAVQARFCKAVMELQMTGLLRMPSKRRPDYIQRVAFGL